MKKKKASYYKEKFAVVSYSQMSRDIEIDFCKYLRKKKIKVIYQLPNNNNIDKIIYKKKFSLAFDKVVQLPNEFEVLNNDVQQEYLYEQISLFEKKFNMSIYRIFFTNRIIGSGFYASGGYNHPATKLVKNTNHHDAMKIALSKLVFWESLFKKYNFQLAINLPDYAHIIAKYYSISSHKLCPARFANRLFWTTNSNYQPDNLEKSFKAIKKKLAPVIINKAYDFHTLLNKKLLENFSLYKTLKTSMINISRISYGKIKGYKKSKNQYLWNVFIGDWRRRNHFIKISKKASVKANNLNQYKYIFFPLQTEPEIALSGIADDFFFQLSSINLIARDLPANYRIIVKEHLLAIGRRPTNFYDQISSLKNVLIADPLDDGLDYIKKSIVVAGITGTSSWEAAVMGIPVISFSKNNAYNFLDHVFYVNEPNNLKNFLSKILKKKWPTKKSIDDGAKFYHAYIKNSFDIGENQQFISVEESKKKEKEVIEKTALLYLDKLLKTSN